MHKTMKQMILLNSCSRIPLMQLMHCLKSVRSQFQLFCRSMNTCHRHTLHVKMTVFWVVALCSLVEVYKRFRGTCCLHHQGDDTQKTAIFILSAVKTSNFINTSCVLKFCYQSVYCCLIRYFLVRIRIAKCFTNSSKRFRCEVKFENGHTFCS
jgi:hypothetical protein